MGLSISTQTVGELRKCAETLKQSNDNIATTAQGMVVYFGGLKNSMGPHADRIEEILETTYNTSVNAKDYVDIMVTKLNELANQIEEYVNNVQGEV